MIENPKSETKELKSLGMCDEIFLTKCMQIRELGAEHHIKEETLDTVIKDINAALHAYVISEGDTVNNEEFENAYTQAVTESVINNFGLLTKSSSEIPSEINPEGRAFIQKLTGLNPDFGNSDNSL